jgi:hypothetical protein
MALRPTESPLIESIEACVRCQEWIDAHHLAAENFGVTEGWTWLGIHDPSILGRCYGGLRL